MSSGLGLFCFCCAFYLVGNRYEDINLFCLFGVFDSLFGVMSNRNESGYIGTSHGIHMNKPRDLWHDSSIYDMPGDVAVLWDLAALTWRLRLIVASLGFVKSSVPTTPPLTTPPPITPPPTLSFTLLNVWCAFALSHTSTHSFLALSLSTMHFKIVRLI